MEVGTSDSDSVREYVNPRARPDRLAIKPRIKGVGVLGQVRIYAEQNTSFDLSINLEAKCLVRSVRVPCRKVFSIYVTLYTGTRQLHNDNHKPHHVLVDAGCLRVITCA